MTSAADVLDLFLSKRITPMDAIHAPKKTSTKFDRNRNINKKPAAIYKKGITFIYFSFIPSPAYS